MACAVVTEHTQNDDDAEVQAVQCDSIQVCDKLELGVPRCKSDFPRARLVVTQVVAQLRHRKLEEKLADEQHKVENLVCQLEEKLADEQHKVENLVCQLKDMSELVQQQEEEVVTFRHLKESLHRQGDNIFEVAEEVTRLRKELQDSNMDCQIQLKHIETLEGQFEATHEESLMKVRATLETRRSESRPSAAQMFGTLPPGTDYENPAPIAYGFEDDDVPPPIAFEPHTRPDKDEEKDRPPTPAEAKKLEKQKRRSRKKKDRKSDRMFSAMYEKFGPSDDEPRRPIFDDSDLSDCAFKQASDQMEDQNEEHDSEHWDPRAPEITPRTRTMSRLITPKAKSLKGPSNYRPSYLQEVISWAQPSGSANPEPFMDKTMETVHTYPRISSNVSHVFYASTTTSTKLGPQRQSKPKNENKENVDSEEKEKQNKEKNVSQKPPPVVRDHIQGDREKAEKAEKKPKKNAKTAQSCCESFL